jgi:hypothetical protein
MTRSSKTGRNYRLFIETTPPGALPALQNAIEIEYPLTIQFDIERNNSSAMNQMNLKIINLGRDTYNQIVKDRYNIQDLGNGNNYRRVVLQAGYTELSTIFVGNLLEANTYRQGTEMMTYLLAQDGAYGAYNGYSNITFDRGIDFKEVVRSLFQNLPRVDPGAIGEIDGVTKRGVVYNGNTYTLLQNNFNKEIFIDLERINLLNPDEVLDGQVFLISDETGLIGSPRRQNTLVIVEMIFEPRINVAQAVEIESRINPRFNGQYKVVGIRHSGTISGAVGGDCKTTLQLFIGTQPNPLRTV